VCSRVSGVEDILLENIAKDRWVFPLIEKGLPRINFVVFCMVILLVILVYCN
jgi:hypothetical protein